MGRGSAVAGIVLVLCLVHPFHMIDAASFTVGDSKGWSFNVENWPNGKSFKAGDTLVFNYNPSSHNVVVVDKGGYEGCKTPKGAKVHQTGKDEIKLNKGPNYFICNFTGHCEGGMKIAVTAA